MRFLAKLMSWGLALFWRGYLAVCLKTSRLSLSEEAEASLAETWDVGVPTVLVFWQEESALTSMMALLPRLRWPLRSLPSGFWAKVNERALRARGVPTVRVPRGLSRQARLSTLERGLGVHRRLLMPADEGKPRGAVRPLAWQLAKSTSACLVAVHLEGTGSVSFFGRRVPLPFGRFELKVSEPYLPSESLEETRRTLQRALDSLRYPAVNAPLEANVNPEFPNVFPRPEVVAQELAVVRQGLAPR